VGTTVVPGSGWKGREARSARGSIDTGQEHIGPRHEPDGRRVGSYSDGKTDVSFGVETDPSQSRDSALQNVRSNFGKFDGNSQIGDSLSKRDFGGSGFFTKQLNYVRRSAFYPE
jgi:hypothetical protein